MSSVTFDPGLGLFSLNPGVVSPFFVTTPYGASAQKALQHVLEHVLCLPSHSGLRLSLMAGGFVKIAQVIGMSSSTIAALSYKTNVPGRVASNHLLLSEVETLIALQGFACFKQACIGHPLDPVSWTTVTKDEFDAYQGSKYHQDFIFSLGIDMGSMLYPDSNMGSKHHGVDHGVDHPDTPEVEGLHDGVDHPDTPEAEDLVEELSKEEDLVEDSPEEVDDLAEGTPEEEDLNLIPSPATAEKNTMRPPNHVHGESKHQNTKHIVTTLVNAADPTYCKGKLDKSPVDPSRPNGGLVHVEGINKHQAHVPPIPITGPMFETLSHVTKNRNQEWEASILDSDPTDSTLVVVDSPATHDTFKTQYEKFTTEPDLWNRPNDDAYKYIVVFVDDFVKAILRPAEFTQLLIDKYKFKLGSSDDLAQAILRQAEFTQLIIDKYKLKVQGIGHSSFHFGCESVQDKEDVLCLKSHKYIKCMVAFHKQMYGEPRKGHLLCAKRVVAYLLKIMCGCPYICIRTHGPDHSGIPPVEHDLATPVYGEIVELVLPSDPSSPKDEMVTLTSSVDDVTQYHDWITGHSVTGTLHFINVTPINWYSKHQSMVETTYGSEFIAAACTCVEQVIDLHSLLHYLGVPIYGHTWMFGDKKPVVSSLAQPHEKWHKRHTALSSCLVRGAISAGYQQVWLLLKLLLFWQRDIDIAKHSLSLAKD